MDHPPLIKVESHAKDETPTDFFGSHCDHHRTLILEYCTLALQPDLSTTDEDRIHDILAQSLDDPLLSFWLDEADHWIEHHLNLLTEDSLKHQQNQLRRRLGPTRITHFWDDLQQRTKALQVYLQQAGLYAGAIDGIMGPRTLLAVESLRQEAPASYLTHPLDRLSTSFGR